MASNDDDWSSNRTLLDCNIYIFDNQVNTDVQFDLKTPDGKSEGTIGAHKYILMARSAVFRAMFSSGLRESSTGRITIDDVPLESFKDFLKFLYTDQMKIDASVIMYLLYAAKRYMVATLVDKCIEYLETHLQPSNACTILEQSIFFDENELEKQCIHVIQHATEQAMGSASSFDKIGPDTVKVILGWDHLSASEMSIYENVLRWSVAQCEKQGFEVTPTNQRKTMSDIIHLVRFPCMSLDNFSDKVSNSGILEDDEELNILRYLTKSTKPVTSFSTKKRLEPPSVKCMLLSTAPKSQYFSKSTYCTVEVSITRPITLHSIYMTELSYISNEILSAINVNIVQNSIELYNGSSSFEVQTLSDPSMQVFYCKLSSPTKVAKGMFQITPTYTLTSNQNPSHHRDSPVPIPSATAPYGEVITEEKNADITSFQCKLISGYCHLVGLECKF